MIMKMEYYHILIPLTNHYQTVIIILMAYFGIIQIDDVESIGVRDRILFSTVVFLYPSFFNWIFPVKLIIMGLTFSEPLVAIIPAGVLYILKLLLSVFMKNKLKLSTDVKYEHKHGHLLGYDTDRIIIPIITCILCAYLIMIINHIEYLFFFILLNILFTWLFITYIIMMLKTDFSLLK